tara:strand:- start:2007 stop:2294 length:288 start_codon:yes stop_codon:yes gene_type:complete
MANKKKKLVDLKPQVDKLTEKELKSIQDIVKLINNCQMQIGGLETQKFDAMSKLKHFQSELNKVQLELENKYGKVSVNIQDGAIKPEQDEIDKKN